MNKNTTMNTMASISAAPAATHVVRGGSVYRWIVKPEGDATWTAQDWGRAATLDARFQAKGVCEEERRRLIPCAVWKAKFPGLQYPVPLEARLTGLLP